MLISKLLQHHLARFLAAAFTLATLASGSITVAANSASDGAVAGHVKKAADASGIANALVIARMGTEVRATATTDSAGAYTLSGLTPGLYNITAQATGYIALTQTNEVVSAGTTLVVDFSLQAATPAQNPGTVSGAVRSFNAGQAISGATVLLLQNGAILQATTTDASGQYTLAQVAAGSYQALAFAIGYEQSSVATIPITANATTILDFILNPLPAPTTGSIAGKVTKAADSTPISGAQVSAKVGMTVAASATSNAQGNYNLGNLAPGTYQLLVTASGFQDATVNNVQVSAGAETVINVALLVAPPPTTGSITGKVTKAADSSVIAGAEVTAKLGVTVAASTTTDAQGNYTLANLAPGSYSLDVEATGYQTATLAGVVVSANSTTTADFALQLLPPPPPVQTGSLTGKVVSAETGAAIVGALEILKLDLPLPLSEEKHAKVVLEGTTDAQGKFSFSGLEPGIYSLRVKAEGHHSAKIGGIAILAGETAVVNVALRPEREREDRDDRGHGKIMGKVTDTVTGAAIAGARVFYTPSRGQDKDDHERRFAQTDKDGKYTPENVLVGSYQIHVQAKGYKPEKLLGVKVEAGQTTTANAALTPLHKEQPKKSHEDDKDDANNREIKQKEQANHGAQVREAALKLDAKQGVGLHLSLGRR